MSKLLYIMKFEMVQQVKIQCFVAQKCKILYSGELGVIKVIDTI